jgi:hypothetical protein
MNRGLLALATSAVLALAIPAAASAGEYQLHPNGFGQKAYASWKAQEGLADSHGTAFQSLYLQKEALQDVSSAGVARISGFEGDEVSSLERLGFWWRKDGKCSGGSPRFNIVFEPTPGAPYQTFFIGCQEMTAEEETTNDNGTFEHRTYDGQFPVGTIVALGIVFDENTPLGPNYVYLDNVHAGPVCWTSPADNGINQPSERCDSPE